MSAALRYAPEFRIAIDGAPAPATLRASVTAVSLQTGLEGVDRVELTLANEGLRWLDHAALKLGQPVLAHRRSLDIQLALDMQFETTIEEYAADLDFRLHLRQLEAVVLEIGQRLTEGVA